jgi:hypothetical protein
MFLISIETQKRLSDSLKLLAQRHVSFQNLEKEVGRLSKLISSKLNGLETKLTGILFF